MDVKDRIKDLLREPILRRNKHALENEDITIFASNCVGSRIAHDLGLRFKSPTVNMYMVPKDFIKFARDPQHYLDLDPVQVDCPDKAYPVGAIDDITVHFVHYHSFDEAKQKWRDRSSRVNLDNCCFIMVDRDGCTEEDAAAFDNLPLSRKAFLTYRDIPGVTCERVVPEWEEDGQVRDLCRLKPGVTGQRWIDDFDYVGFFNSAPEQQDGDEEGRSGSNQG